MFFTTNPSSNERFQSGGSLGKMQASSLLPMQRFVKGNHVVDFQPPSQTFSPMQLVEKETHKPLYSS